MAALLLLLLLLLPICFPASSSSLVLAIPTLASQAATLLSLKDSFSPPLPPQLRTWTLANYASLCSSWPGVACAPGSNRTVVSLDISGYNISGTLSPAIGDLAGLRFLSAAANSLAGDIPPDIAALRNLRHLNLSNNQFNGTLDALDFSAMPSLEVLDLYDNDLAGALPTLLPAGLRHLDLGGNFFSGTIPPSLGRFPAIEFLSLAGNSLSGPIPPDLANLSSTLRHLFLGYFNRFDGGIPPELGRLTSLVHLDLASCGLQGPIPASLGDLTALDTLYLQTNQLNGTIPPSLGNLTGLRFLDVSNNALTGEIPPELAALGELRLLNMFINRFRGGVPDFLADLRSLQVLKLWQNNFTGAIPAALGRAAPLREVDLSTNRLTGEVPRWLCARGQLEILILLDNFLFGPVPEGLGAACPTLTRVRLGHNYLTGPLPRGFLYLPALTTVELQGNYLTGRLEEEEEEEEERGEEAEAEAEAMLRGGGSRAPAKPRRPHSHSHSHSRHRAPSPPTPSRRASGAVASASPAESKEPAALEAPVVSSVEETSFTFEFKRGFKRAKKAMPLPVDAPRGEDNSREGLSSKSNAVPVKKDAPKQVEFTHCSPGIVARLMGLDTVPRPKKPLDRCQSDTRANLQRHLSGVVRDVDSASSGDQTCNLSSDELPALKDVFEVTEMENMAMHEQLQPGNQEPYLTNIEADLEFVRQKFLDAKRLATGEGNMNSKEFSEALEVLHSKRDVFLEILQENRTAVSGFSGQILSHSGLQCSSHTSNAAAAQSFEEEIPCGMEGVCDGMHDIPKEFEKPIPSVPLRETSVAPVAPLAPNEGKSKGSCHRSQIVVLKPNLQRKSFTPVLSSQEAPQYKQRSGTQHSKPPHHSKQFSLPRNNEVLEGERGSALQKVRKQTPKSSSRRRLSQEEYNLEVDTEKAKVSSNSHDDTMPFYSSIHSAGPSVSRKARKHLSERWQMACQSGSENSIPKGIKTLGEMLGLSDRDAPRETSHRGGSDPNFNPYNVREVPGSPLGISSKDGWKTGIYCEDDSRAGTSRNFPRSKSLPSSSTTSAKLSGRRQSAPTRRLPILKDILNSPTDESENAHIRKRSPIRNAKQKNGKSTVYLGKENMLPEKEIHVTSEKARHSICISDLSRASNIHTEKCPDDAIRTEDQEESDSALQHDYKEKTQGFMGCTYQTLATSSPETKEVLSIQNQDNIELKEEREPSVEIEVDQVDTRATESASIASAESCDCSSPTALSQHSSGEETYCGIFKSINVGIQELREQLKMLKMEDQDDICEDYSGTLSSDEFDNVNISIYRSMEEQLSMFKDEEDRDFSYVQDMLASVCDLPDHPEDWQVSSDVFLCLENKYSKLVLWLKSDRKLLFDFVNSILADMIIPDNALHSKIMMKCLPEIDRGQLAENVWQMVQKRSNNGHFFLEDVQPLPLDYRSEVELVGMNIARIIHDDIIRDCIVEFMSQENFNYLVTN